ncbi:MAG: hypothetical protein HY897_23985 [Deltaproteobacteria bacterium]|nr:hypothetical protein [Deltaproteobacteria bacterium]
MKNRTKTPAGTLRAFELDGMVDRNHRLRVDEPLPVEGPSRVKVIVLVPVVDELSERDYFRIAMNDPAFGFLKDSAEDVYSAADGKAFRDKR